MIFLCISLLNIAIFAESGLLPDRHQGGPHHHEASVPLTQASPPRSSSVAICKLVSSTGNNVAGDIVLRQENPEHPVEITGVISGLTPGYHGFHVHQNSDLSDNCKAAGPHFNPHQATHGAPYDPVRHAGDLGNIPADNDGHSTFQFLDKGISLFEGATQVLGKSIVVHAKEDDLGRGGNEESAKTGNAGARVACCVVEPVHQYFNE